MEKPSITHLQHTHTFGQDELKEGERRSLIVIGITAVMMVIEIAAGISFGSMALLADGLHMASHACALSITAFAYIYARKRAADPRFSFGTGKVNALGGFTGALLLAGFAFMMAWESVDRLINPTAIAFNWAIGVAIVGLVVNGACMFVLGNHGHHHHHHHSDGGHERSHSHEHDHNLRSAYLHVMADALTSVTAIIALLAAKHFGLIWMDPLMGIVGSLLVANWSIGLLKATSQVLLDHQAPEETLQRVRDAVERDGDAQVVDLHLWSIGPGIFNATLTVVATTPRGAEDYKSRLPSDVGIVHATVEIHHSQSDASPAP